MKERIVEKGLKIDLHIHSSLSSHKDGDKVSDNTIFNLDKLVQGLNKHKVNMCSITDHDAFNYKLYKKLKKEEGKGSIKKVFPGVEFSVEYEHNDLVKQLHIVTLFEDTDTKKVENIANVLQFYEDKPKYDRGKAFSEKEFIRLLSEINLNTVMIVHQKGSLLSKKKPVDNNANSLGEEKLQEFLYTEYFEAYEFRNKKNELFSKKYVVDNKYQDLLRLITSSDCHSWEHYPQIDCYDEESFEYTWLKCLPTFRGLVMSMTDYTRIKRNDSFFSVDDKKLSNIEIRIDKKVHQIPLSKGLNVIIGDNSIGKSLLLHKLLLFIKTKSKVKRGYEKYLSDNNMDILTSIEDNKLFMFDGQSEIRQRFEDGTLNDTKLLKSYYPAKLSTLQYTNVIDKEIAKYCKSLENKINYTKKLNNLSDFNIFIPTTNTETLSLIDDIQSNSKIKNRYSKAIVSMKEIYQELQEYVKEYGDVITSSENIKINEFIDYSLKINIRMNKKIYKLDFEDKKINIIINRIKKTNANLTKIKSDIDKESSDFDESHGGWHIIDLN